MNDQLIEGNQNDYNKIIDNNNGEDNLIDNKGNSDLKLIDKNEGNLLIHGDEEIQKRNSNNKLITPVDPFRCLAIIKSTGTMVSLFSLLAS